MDLDFVSQPLSLRALLARTARIYVADYDHILPVTLLFVVPLCAFSLLGSTAAQKDISSPPVILTLLVALLGTILTSVIGPFVQLILADEVMFACGGREIRLALSLRRAWPRLASYLGSSLLAGLVIGFLYVQGMRLATLAARVAFGWYAAGAAALGEQWAGFWGLATPGAALTVAIVRIPERVWATFLLPVPALLQPLLSSQMRGMSLPGALLVILSFSGPMVYLLARWLVTMPALLAEHLGPVAAMRRSWQLTHGRVSTAAGCLLAAWATFLPVAALVQWLVRLLEPLGGSAASLASTIVLAIAALIWLPALVIACTLVYTYFSYNSRVSIPEDRLGAGVVGG